MSSAFGDVKIQTRTFILLAYIYICHKNHALGSWQIPSVHFMSIFLAFLDEEYVISVVRWLLFLRKYWVWPSGFFEYYWQWFHHLHSFHERELITGSLEQPLGNPSVLRLRIGSCVICAWLPKNEIEWGFSWGCGTSRDSFSSRCPHCNPVLNVPTLRTQHCCSAQHSAEMKTNFWPLGLMKIHHIFSGFFPPV